MKFTNIEEASDVLWVALQQNLNYKFSSAIRLSKILIWEVKNSNYAFNVKIQGLGNHLEFPKFQIVL